jgi:hypothetical protein
MGRERDREGERDRDKNAARDQNQKKRNQTPISFFPQSKNPITYKCHLHFTDCFPFEEREKTSIHISEQTNKQSREQGKNGGV